MLDRCVNAVYVKEVGMAHPPVAARLQALREQMQFQSVQASIWPTSDPHLSEYLPDRWKSRQWLSGFVGSAGLLVVTADWAGLWTDSRYWEQAAKELDGSGIQLQRAGEAGVPEPANWLAEHLPAQSRVALDSQSVSAQSLLAWQKATPELEWVLEADIEACFDNIDHTVLMSILRERLHDNRFLALVGRLLKALRHESPGLEQTRNRLGLPQNSGPAAQVEGDHRPEVLHLLAGERHLVAELARGQPQQQSDQADYRRRAARSAGCVDGAGRLAKAAEPPGQHLAQAGSGRPGTNREPGRCPRPDAGAAQRDQAPGGGMGRRRRHGDGRAR